MFYLCLYLAKLTRVLIDLTGKGSGFTWPGHLALKLKPDILSSPRVSFPRGIILVSGTNGKTTTTKIITHILNNSGLKVLHNSTGANLENGIVSQILLSMDLRGRLFYDVAVFEVDEFTLPGILARLTPKALILLNLSRDQLDRYGETDTIFERWLASVSCLSTETLLILDKDQEKFTALAEAFAGKTVYFDEAFDYLSTSGLEGSFNARNINAALRACEFLNIDSKLMSEALSSFKAAYGRGESLSYYNKDFRIFLAKNPASFGHNLDVIIKTDMNVSALLFVLNDNIPDGRDVSWIYDITAEKLKNACAGRIVYVSGTRALDMAVRISYADVAVDEDNVVVDLKIALSKIVQNDAIESVLVLPNYSAMLQARKILVGRKIL